MLHAIFPILGASFIEFSFTDTTHFSITTSTKWRYVTKVKVALFMAFFDISISWVTPNAVSYSSVLLRWIKMFQIVSYSLLNTCLLTKTIGRNLALSLFICEYFMAQVKKHIQNSSCSSALKSRLAKYNATEIWDSQALYYVQQAIYLEVNGGQKWKAFVAFYHTTSRE